MPNNTDMSNMEELSRRYVFGRLMSSYKLNYDMKIETMSETKSETDGKKVVDQLFRGGRFFRFIRWILRRGTPDKITESKSEKSFLHFKIKDLALNFSPENSDLSQGHFAWIGSGGVEYAEVDLPGDDNKIRETLQGLDEIPPGHPMASFAKKLSTRLQEKPINAIFMLKIKCENESIKELVFELSYDVPEYIFAYQFTLWHTFFPEIETNLSAEVVRTKEVAKEITKDTKDFQSDSDTAHLVTTLPLVTGFTSKLGTRIKEFLDLLKGKHVIITYKNLNIINANEKLADGVYKKEFSTPIKMRAFGGKMRSTGTHKTTGEIKLEIRFGEEKCQIEITSVSTQTACPNQKITFIATSDSDGTINWRGGGQPPTGSGNSFTTAFKEEGIKMVSVTLTTESGTCTDDTGVMIRNLSGADWVDLFPKSDLISDLEPSFGNKVQAFCDQLLNDGAEVQTDTTYRPPERAYLMHYSYRIANGEISPQNVPYYPGVEICWVHRDENGNMMNLYRFIVLMIWLMPMKLFTVLN